MKRYQARRQSSYNRRGSFSTRRFERKSRNKFLFTIIVVIFLSYAMLFWILPAFIGSLSYINQFKSTSSPKVTNSDDISLAPPVLNIPYEATNTATIQIKGYASPQTEVQIFIDDDLKSTTQTADDGSFLSTEVNLNLGTNNIYGKTADDKGGQSLPSKNIQIIYDNEKPELEIREPEDNKVIQGGDKKVTVSGSTDSNASVSVNINGIMVIVGSDGNFAKTIDINEGDNNLVITATDKAGNPTQISRKVIYNP